MVDESGDDCDRRVGAARHPLGRWDRRFATDPAGHHGHRVRISAPTSAWQASRSTQGRPGAAGYVEAAIGGGQCDRRDRSGRAASHPVLVDPSRRADRRTRRRAARGLVRDRSDRARGSAGPGRCRCGPAVRRLVPGRRRRHAAVPTDRGEHLDQHRQQPRLGRRVGDRRVGARTCRAVLGFPGRRRTARPGRAGGRRVRRPTGGRSWRRRDGRSGRDRPEGRRR